MNLEYLEKTAELSQVTDKLYHIMLYRVHFVWAGFELTTLVFNSDRLVVGFPTTCTYEINAYEIKSIITKVVCTNHDHGKVYSKQHYLIKIVSDFGGTAVFSGLFHQWNWPLRYMWNIVESGVKCRTWREPPTMGMQLVNFITCGCESSAPFLQFTKPGAIPRRIWDRFVWVVK
jgi:hypothetical protein